MADSDLRKEDQDIERAAGEVEKTPARSSSQRSSVLVWLIGSIEVALIFTIFFGYAASPPPNVNESHYLTKAKAYWNPEWCPNDLFLDSSDAHLVFYWAFGWLTLFFSLPTVAWIGRIIVWLLTAIAWQRFSSAVNPRPLIAPLTAGLSLLLLHHFHMAGEWLIGGVEAKGFAFAFVFFGLAKIVRGEFRWCWILFGIASAIHVLVGGWSVIAAFVAWLIFGKERTGAWKMLPFLAIGFVCSLAGLIPGVVLTMGVEPKTVDIANQIYTFGRLEHHLVFSAFEPSFVIRHGCLAAVWFVLFLLTIKSKPAWRLNSFVLGAVLIAGVGIAIDQILLVSMGDKPLAAKLLRFYWFRMSDVFIPIGVSFSVLQLAISLSELKKLRPLRMVFVPIAGLAVAISVAWFLKTEFDNRQLDPRPRAYEKFMPVTELNRDYALDRQQDWETACKWIAENTPSDSVFLTPLHQQTFKWYAHRSEVISAKDIPQDARRIVDWQQRYQTAYPGFVEYPWGVLDQRAFGIFAYPDEAIESMGNRYKARYFITERRFAFNRISRTPMPIEFKLVYPPDGESSQYGVYEIIDAQ